MTLVPPFLSSFLLSLLFLLYLWPWLLPLQFLSSAEILRLLVPRGFVAVDGSSLTVCAMLHLWKRGGHRRHALAFPPLRCISDQNDRVTLCSTTPQCFPSSNWRRFIAIDEIGVIISFSGRTQSPLKIPHRQQAPSLAVYFTEFAWPCSIPCFPFLC